MRFALATLALLPAAAFGLSISDPSTSGYWVQNTSNTIHWSFNSGDPSPVDIIVVNGDNATLNGPFSIAQFVDTSTMSFTVTNVTLKVGSGFEVQFVSPQNHSQVFASSQDFDVKTPGTPPPQTSSDNSTSSSSSSASSSAPSPSGSTATQRPPPALDNGAFARYGSQGVFGAILACGVASLAVLL
ncbi:hypothetical protein BDW22DRAFT_1362128 [Trametopsis cervina]|nr:hypothetical protein BDW22DRAFT_1362128 [Trametopsis cervina]